MTNSRNDKERRVLLTVEQAAECLGIGRTSVYALLKAGQLHSVRLGRLRRIPMESIDAYVAHLAQQQ